MVKSSIAIITARGGSKRIPRKNIKNFLGEPIISYAIKAALQSKIFDVVMVSTDDLEIAKTSMEYGADVPFIRSSHTSNDYATTEEVLKEVILEYQKKGIEFQYACCIYPTAPLVTSEKLKNALAFFLSSQAESLIPVVKYSYPPQRSFIIRGDGNLKMKYPEHIETRSQDLEEWYHDCGQFYFFKTDVFLKNGTILTDCTVPLILSEREVQDIDTHEDWIIAEMKYQYLYLGVDSQIKE